MLRNILAALLIALPVAGPSATALAEDFTQRVEARSGGTLDVDLRAGKLEIETHDLEEVRVDAYSRSGLFGGAMKFSIQSDGTDVELDGKGGWFTGDARVRIRVPRKYSLEVRTGGGNVDIAAVAGSVEARTSGGRIILDGARGDVELRTSGGPIEVRNVVGELEARTSGGQIRVEEVDGEIDVETSGGPIWIYDVSGPVKAKTSGGSIEVRFAGRPEGDIETSGGGIVAELPEGEGIDLDARTSGGRVTLDSPVKIELRGDIDPNHVRGTINGGGPELKLRTSGGNVRVLVR